MPDDPDVPIVPEALIGPRIVIVVVAAVIEHDGAFLVTRRLEGTHLAGLWEFPGGKVAEGETHAGALTREIREELDADVDVGALVFETEHAYADRSIVLHFYRCTLRGRPRPLLGQQMRWVPRAELRVLDFPPADAELIRLLTDNDSTGIPTHENRIEVVPYDPGWPAAFEAEALRLRAALKELALRIDHHGSTAVPGLAAKPIIDIQVSVTTLEPLSAYGRHLEAIGYTHVPHPDDSFCPFFHRPIHWPHSHHVHVVRKGGSEERRTLAFRDYLRDHSDVARGYEDLKRSVAATMMATDPESQERYARAKTDFVERFVVLAIANGYPRDL